MGYGLRYEYGMFRQIHSGWLAARTAGQLAAIPGPVGSRSSSRDGGSQTQLLLRAARRQLAPIPGRPSSLIGVPFDRPVVGYGGQTINTLRLWAAATPDFFDFEEFSRGDFASALAETLAAESLTRVLYPDDSTSMGQGLRFVQEYFLVACSLADIGAPLPSNQRRLECAAAQGAIQMNDTHPAMAVPELMRILLDEAKLDGTRPGI